MKIIITIGAPCSGKSTWAKEQAQCFNTIRVNRDELRIMLNGKYVSGNKQIESIVDKLVGSTIYAAYTKNINIIIDATHCKMKYIDAIKDALDGFEDIEFEYHLFEVSFWKQKMRNIFRYIKTGIHIPHQIISSMNANYKVTKHLIYTYEKNIVFHY